jgi:dipeptidase D
MAYKISVKGLTGGHSGMDIHRGRGNANKIMNRLLLNLTRDLTIEIASVDGGSLRNAIPRESVSVITVGDANNLKKCIKEFESIIQAEYKTTDPNVVITIEETEIPTQVVSADFQYKLLRSIYACPFGIYRMSSDIAGLVQTSNNVARVIVKDGAYQIQCLTRSSVDSEKLDLQHAITSAFELMGANIVAAGSYPGWTPKPSAPIVKLMSDLYKERYHSEAKVSACHAGLECGILGTNYPDMQMISFGPNIKGAHSPDERAQISSVQKYWGFLLETLVRIPKK